MGNRRASRKKSRRRSARILLRIPLLIGKSNPSTAEWESVETVMLSLHGGLLRTNQDLEVNTAIEIRKRNNERAAHARVVWKSSQNTPYGIDLGFEIIDDPEFWGISFPSESP